jgi:hypothetical protein
MKTLFGALAGASLISGAAVGNTLYVANNGTDSPSCGAATAPCRSISQSIVNATAGDTILVKPGRYGDLDGDGALGSVGEETGNHSTTLQGGVYVDKALTILSTAGAGATVIDIGLTRHAAVELAADGIRFGDKGRGFTLAGGQSYGLYAWASHLSIAGNSASGHAFAGFLVNARGPVEVRANEASDNDTGFWVTGFQPVEVVTMTGNLSARNQTGIATGGIAPHRIVDNVVSKNTGWGVILSWGALRFSHNQVTGNQRGLHVNGTSDQPVAPVITRNNFVGNVFTGLDVIMGPTGGTLRVRENNFFGNGSCAVTNQSMQAFTLDARNNYWGASTGPSWQDPADPVCVGNQPIVTTPFAAAEFDVR